MIGNDSERWPHPLAACGAFEQLLADVDDLISIGEDDTLLVRLWRLEAELGLACLWLKDESRNPTWFSAC